MVIAVINVRRSEIEIWDIYLYGIRVVRIRFRIILGIRIIVRVVSV